MREMNEVGKEGSKLSVTVAWRLAGLLETVTARR